MKQLIKPLLVLLLVIHVHGCSNTISRERNVSNTVTQLHGTLSLVYSELYGQKKAMLEKFNDRNNASVNNFVIVDGKTGALYTIDLIRMNPAVVNELFSKIDAMGSKKKNGRKPIFIIKAKVTVSKPVDWETESSGWGTVYTPFKPERGVVKKFLI